MRSRDRPGLHREASSRKGLEKRAGQDRRPGPVRPGGESTTGTSAASSAGERLVGARAAPALADCATDPTGRRHEVGGIMSASKGAA